MFVKSIGITDDVKMIREEVFVVEQEFKYEFDDIDPIAVHMAFYEERRPVAICRYYKGEEEGQFVLGRIAVDKAYRGKNMGRYVIETAEKEMIKEGAKSVKLSAQVRVQEFYEKCGYHAEGETYYEEHVLHIGMKKEL